MKLQSTLPGQRALTCSKAVKDAVFAQDRVAVGADQHTCLGIPENVILLQQACQMSEDMFRTNNLYPFKERTCIKPFLTHLDK